MKKFTHIAVLILLVFLAVENTGRPLWAAAPLLMEGKKTLYQRVITHPGAALYDRPGGPAGNEVVPFTVMYVYDRLNGGERDWVRAAANTQGKNLAWLPAETVSDWKQSLVLLFAERAGRDPLLFFKSPADLENIAGQSGIASALAALGREFQAYAGSGAAPPEDMPVAAMEPPDEEGAVPYDSFYLMPIFSFQEPFEGVKLLEVGSIDPGSGESPAANNEADKSQKSGQSPTRTEGYPKSAIAFVIDTTISMGPYIDKSLDITRSIYDEVSRQKRGDSVALGVVAFRNSLEATPRLEYTSKVISPLRKATDRAAFEEALGQVKEARVSTHAFNEDASSGLLTAIKELDWSPYDGRVIILITDAGPLPITDPYQSTMMSTREMADLAKDNKIKIITVHVKSAKGKTNHDYAREAYQKLSPPDGDLSTYFPLEAATPEAGAEGFAETVDNMVDNLSQALFGDPSKVKSPEGGPAAEGSQDQAREIGRLLGYSIRLEYLGRVNQSRAPQVVRSWIADQDLGLMDESRGAGQRKVRTVQPAVLLTKLQLSILSRQLKIIIDEAEKGMKSDTDIFQNILSASSQMVNDPDIYAKKPNANLVELGVLGEFLEDLPYKSDVMVMTEQDWRDMNTGQQYQFLARLKSLVARYNEYDQDLDHWGKFGNPDSVDWLYRVPLNMLP